MQQNPILFNSEQQVLVNGESLDMPESLYIPPDALRVVLNSFSGPLDLLLYLIRKQNLDILDIPIFTITKQYMQYVDLMKNENLELAAEYLLMAAILGEIKSRMLLPRLVNEDDDEEDHRAELIKRLQEYERFKIVSDNLDQLPRLNRDNFVCQVFTNLPDTKTQAKIELDDIFQAFIEVSKRAELFSKYNVTTEFLSVKDRIQIILGNLKNQKTCEFSKMFSFSEGKSGVVVTFLAILELMRDQIIEIAQSQDFNEIYLQIKDI